MSPNSIADSVNQTTLDSIRSFDTALLIPSTRAVYPDKIAAVYDDLEKKGGAMIGRAGGDWADELRVWLGRGQSTAS